MPRYSILGLNVELPWTLDLPRSAGTPDAQIELHEAQAISSGPDDEPIVIRRKESALEFTFYGLCSMTLPAEGEGLIRVVPDLEADPHEVRRQVLEHLIPRLLSRRHALVLHASCVVLHQGAVGFVAPSGSGKSTLALAFGRRGAEVLGDDSLVLDQDVHGAIARPLWSNVRIHQADLAEGHSALVRLPAETHQKAVLHEGDEIALRFTRQGHPLRAIYLLEKSSEAIEIRRMPAREALLALMRESYHLEFDDMPGLARLMTRIENLQLPLNTYRLSYPHDLERISELCERVSAHAAGA